MNYEAIALWSQVVAAVVFAALIVVGFIRFLTPTIARMTAAKNDEIRESEKRRDEAVQRARAARSEIAEATTDAARIKEHIERDARREAAIIVATAHSEAQRLVRNAHADYERSRAAARDRLRIEMIDKALAAARKTVLARIDEKAEATLVGRFIDELEGKGDLLVADETLARRYAQAVFDLAKDGGKIAETGRDLRTIWDAMQGRRRSRALLLRSDHRSRREAKSAGRCVLR